MTACEETAVTVETWPSFWRWFFRGSGAGRGFRRLANRWLLLHVAVGAGVAAVVDTKLSEIAGAILFPFASVFVGLAFAWAVNAQALMQSAEIGKLAEHHKGGFVEYVYTYQTAILALLVTLVVWGLAGLEVFDGFGPGQERDALFYVSKLVLFTLCSLSIRECWHVVGGTSQLLLSRRQIRQAMGRQHGEDADGDAE